MNTLNDFIWADYVIVGMIALSSLIGLSRGLIREALSLAGWILAIWVAITFNSEFAKTHYLATYIHSNEIRTAVSFFILFLAVLFAISIVAMLISQLTQRTGLSGTDRLLGVLFGVARGVILVALILLLLRFTPLPKESWWSQSRTIPHFQSLENWLHGLLPKSVALPIKSSLSEKATSTNMSFDSSPAIAIELVKKDA